MDDLNVLKKYIGEKIKSIEENDKLIEQKQQQVAKLEKIYSPLISGNYANIDKNYLRDCFGFIFEGEDVNLIIERIYQSITIVSDDRFAKEPQKPVAEEYLNKINTLLLTNIEKLKENIMKIKSEADDKISEYEEYFDLIKDGKIVRHLNENGLKRFFKFLNESSLDKNVILNLTVLFSKDSLDYAENLRKLKIVREETVKKDNVAKVKEQIKQQNRNKVEEPKSEVAEVEFALTSKENEIYYKMLEVMNILTNDIELSHDVLVDILSDDYSLEARKSIYDSTDDKFNLILEDLKVNLIPNFKDNKDDVISIFKYIIDLFNEEYKKQEEVSLRFLPLEQCQIIGQDSSKESPVFGVTAENLSNICLIAAPILAPNLPISGNTAEYPATGSSIKNPVFMRVCGHFEARRTTWYDPNVITPKRDVACSSHAGGATIPYATRVCGFCAC